MNPLFVGFIKAGLAIAVNTVVSSLVDGQQSGGQKQIKQQNGVFVSNEEYNNLLQIQAKKERMKRIVRSLGYY